MWGCDGLGLLVVSWAYASPHRWYAPVRYITASGRLCSGTGRISVSFDWKLWNRRRDRRQGQWLAHRALERLFLPLTQQQIDDARFTSLVQTQSTGELKRSDIDDLLRSWGLS